jgi:hypothetical protein
MSDGYDQTVYGLLRRRAIIASEIRALHDQMQEKIAAVAYLDGAIRVFNPAIDLEDMPERPVPPANAAFRGEVQRALLGILRAAGEAQTTLELTDALMKVRGLNTADRILFKVIHKRVGHAMSRLRKAGHVESEKAGRGADLRWTLVAHARFDVSVGGWRNGSG